MTYVGGLRARLIRDSIYRTLNSGLTELGWFDSGRSHLPIHFEPTSIDDSQAVEKNTAALADWDTTERPDELGSLLAEHRHTYYVDFYAENDAIGVHFMTDVKDILGGRMPSIGRSEPTITVYDWTQATPPAIFTVSVENIIIDRPMMPSKPWHRFMRTVRFEIVDHYSTDD